MSLFFITGTDTNVGKSVVSSVLLYALECFYWKPIESGNSESTYVKHLTQLPDKHFLPPVYSLSASLSPDQAARRENVTIQLENCELPKERSLIIEGAGGIYVPLNDHACMLDLIERYQAPAIIVSRGTLGTINHTLLTIEVLRQKNIEVKGIIFNGELNPENQSAIEKWGNVRTLFHIPFFDNLTPQNLQQWVNDNRVRIKENVCS